MDKPVLAPAFYEELASENPLGIKMSVGDVAAWWHFIAWPRYKTYQYRSHKRAIRRWWANVTMGDIERARESRQRHFEEREQEIQDSLQ